MKRKNEGQASVTHVILLAITMIVFVALLVSVRYIGFIANKVASEAQFMRISGYVSSEIVRAYNLALSSNSSNSMISVSLSLPRAVCGHIYGITIKNVDEKPRVVAYAQDNANIDSFSPVCNVNAKFSGIIYSSASQPAVRISRSSNEVINICLGNSL